MARETIGDVLSTFCIWLIIPSLTVSLLYLLLESQSQLLLIGLLLLAVVFFIKKQLTKTKATQHYKSLI
jgi:ribose/xylose/arabinose/galactoside ABC-type transport system permease subunit